MRIALRTSGGRGEYELAGAHGDIKLADAFGKPIFFEILPGHRIATGNYAKRSDGKPRIRLLPKNASLRPRHAYLILADALLLPKPKREIGATPSFGDLLRTECYSITSIQIDVVDNSSDVIVTRPTDLALSNASKDVSRVNVIDRMKLVMEAWNQAKGRSDPLSGLLISHADAFQGGNDQKIKEAAARIRALLPNETDPLSEIYASMGIAAKIADTVQLSSEEFITDVDLSEVREAARNRLKEWRLQSVRGPSALMFSGKVKEVYNNTCLFTGYRLPRLVGVSSAGVDSAHILPWATHDLDSVPNGLCLNKLCHWAFDAGILKIDFDSNKEAYRLSIRDYFIEAESEKKIDLGPFHGLTGIIPKDRLPADKKYWPNPDFIDEYNKELDPLFT